MRDRADILGYAPFIVVEDADELLRRVGDIVHRSNEIPLVKAASPKIATTSSLLRAGSRAAQIPGLPNNAVPACAAP